MFSVYKKNKIIPDERSTEFDIDNIETTDLKSRVVHLSRIKPYSANTTPQVCGEMSLFLL